MHLYGKKESINLRGSPDQANFMKIIIVDTKSSDMIASINLSVPQCYRLLKLDSESDL